MRNESRSISADRTSGKIESQQTIFKYFQEDGYKGGIQNDKDNGTQIMSVERSRRARHH